MRFIILAAIAFGLYQLYNNPSSFINFFSGGVHEVNVEKLGYDLRQQSGKKIVMLFSSDFRNCPCQGAMPAIDSNTFPNNVARFVVALDKDRSAVERYRKYFTNGNVTWFWLGSSCTTPDCANLIPQLEQIGIHYKGQMPYIEVFDGNNARGYPQSPPAESIACIASGACTYTCTGNTCAVRQ